MTLFFKKPVILTRVKEDNKEFLLSFKKTYPNINTKNFFKSMPLIEIEFEKDDKKSIDYNYLIFTSRYGIQSVANIPGIKEKNIFCVGKATAVKAKEAGFKKVFYPEFGNASNLIKLICLKVNDKNFSLHYLRGKEISYDLKKELKKFGYKVCETIVYRQISRKLSYRFYDSISKENVGGIVFFSANIARLFCEKVKKVPEDFLFFCISDRVAKEVIKTQIHGNYQIRIASEPTTKEMMNLIYHEIFIRPH